MTKGQYPTITTGMGNLTPDLWRRLMTMLRSYEEKIIDETRTRSSTGASALGTDFLARIYNARCIGANRYEYAWVQVSLNDDNTVTPITGGKTSTGENDQWDFSALNTIEINNTSTYASGGVDMSGDEYPVGYSLQVLGGGSCSGTGCTVTPTVLPVVVMKKITGSSAETPPRYVFSAVNEHDGLCGRDTLVITDAVAEPDAVSGKAQIWMDVTDSKLHWKDDEDNTYEIDDTP